MKGWEDVEVDVKIRLPEKDGTYLVITAKNERLNVRFVDGKWICDDQVLFWTRIVRSRSRKPMMHT